jgi:biopolymer transport protein ExbB
MIDMIQNGCLQLEDYLRAGGMVMLPLALVSLVMWVLIADRALFFKGIPSIILDPKNIVLIGS